MAIKNSFINTPRSKVESKDVEINGEIRQLLIATLLGDGCLSKPKRYKNARFQMRHSIRQRHWFFYKAKKTHRSMFEKTRPPSKGRRSLESR